MRWFGLVLLCTVLAITCAEPEPKKYRPEFKPKEKQANTSLTDEERKFLREVEEKFGIKADVPVENNDDDEDQDPESSPLPQFKPPFPAVIAIEIVNDTDSKSKGKRTIDANLGYGYQTNKGYTYTYFGKPAQERGKFMIYPYSQEDIPPAGASTHNSGYSQHTSATHVSPNVEITPSQAFELVPAKNEDAYHYEKPAVEFKSESYQTVQTPPPEYPASESHTPQTPPSTLYTTYNGEQFSGLSGQFPKVMSNYFVDPSQLLNNPQYQNAGLTRDHLRTHGAQLEQRVVPVLVLRVPSSYLKNPSAELYANLPHNYPLSQYLNNVNLQELVNQYFKKIGYPYAPQVMAYPSSVSTPVQAYQAPHMPAPVHSYQSQHLPSSIQSPVSPYEPQQYASPYVQPSYTHADYSGVQYSAVQPVMARYPSSYPRQQYYITRAQSLYRQPLQQQQYVYRYRYVPQSAVQQMSYYVQPQYQHQQEAYQQSSQEPQHHHVSVDQSSSVPDSTANTKYGHQQTTNDESHLTSVEYNAPQTQGAHQEYEHAQPVTPSHESEQTVTPQYELPQENASPEYEPTKLSIPSYGAQTSQAHQTVQVQYEQPASKDTIAVFSRGQTGHKFTYNPQSDASQSYVYQKQTNEHSASDSLPLSENYPSKDHTIATVLPLSYKTRNQNSEPVQAVSYVTPLPHMQYQSQYRVMGPQNILKGPTNEKVLYVNSHSLPSYSQMGSSKEYNPEAEYTVGTHYVPPASKQKPPLYPRNYHSHPKRMTKPENKSDTAPSSIRKHNDRNEKKNSS